MIVTLIWKPYKLNDKVRGSEVKANCVKIRQSVIYILVFQMLSRGLRFYICRCKTAEGDKPSFLDVFVKPPWYVDSWPRLGILDCERSKPGGRVLLPGPTLHRLPRRRFSSLNRACESMRVFSQGRFNRSLSPSPEGQICFYIFKTHSPASRKKNTHTHAPSIRIKLPKERKWNWMRVGSCPAKLIPISLPWELW